LQKGIRALLGRFAATEREDVTACCGITPAQAATLDTLRRGGPLRLSALATRLRIRPSTLTRNVRRMEAHGLIERLRDARDARAERVSLTAVGAATARSFETLEEDLALDVLRRVPARRRASVVAGLMELVRAFSEATEACCIPAREAGAQCEPWGHPRASAPPRAKKTRPRREG
jgi:DNA-binding MarR family transcriptional regulator